MSVIDEAVNNKLVKAAIAGIDFDAMAEELRPEIETLLKKEILRHFKEDFYVTDVFDGLYNTVEEGLDKVIRESFNLPTNKKKGKK